jgi:hypothetical protein
MWWSFKYRDRRTTDGRETGGCNQQGGAGPGDVHTRPADVLGRDLGAQVAPAVQVGGDLAQHRRVRISAFSGSSTGRGIWGTQGRRAAVAWSFPLRRYELSCGWEADCGPRPVRVLPPSRQAPAASGRAQPLQPAAGHEPREVRH